MSSNHCATATNASFFSSQQNQGSSPSKVFGKEAVKVMTKPVPEKLDGPLEVATVAGGELFCHIHGLFR